MITICDCILNLICILFGYFVITWGLSYLGLEIRILTWIFSLLSVIFSILGWVFTNLYSIIVYAWTFVLLVLNAIYMFAWWMNWNRNLHRNTRNQHVLQFCGLILVPFIINQLAMPLKDLSVHLLLPIYLSMYMLYTTKIPEGETE